jgi:hypothetical protein
MGELDPEKAYIVANSFLRDLAERTNNDELMAFYAMGGYIAGRELGGDPAMWYDWLARVQKVQTGQLIPDKDWRGDLTAEMMQPLDAEQAYLAMFEYLEEYWIRVKRPREFSDILGAMRYTPGVGTADPSIWNDWLAAFNNA